MQQTISRPINLFPGRRLRLKIFVSVYHHFPCDLVGVVWHFNASASNVLANSWIRMRGKKMSYSVLTRCSMKTRNSLMSRNSLLCPLCQVLFCFCSILDLFFKIVKAVFDHYTLIITRLSNSHFLYSGNRCHQWNKWDYNYLWSGIYCSIHIHSVPWLTIWQ